MRGWMDGQTDGWEDGWVSRSAALCCGVQEAPHAAPDSSSRPPRSVLPDGASDWSEAPHFQLLSCCFYLSGNPAAPSSDFLAALCLLLQPQPELSLKCSIPPSPSSSSYSSSILPPLLFSRHLSLYHSVPLISLPLSHLPIHSCLPRFPLRLCLYRPPAPIPSPPRSTPHSLPRCPPACFLFPPCPHCERSFQKASGAPLGSGEHHSQDKRTPSSPFITLPHE